MEIGQVLGGADQIAPERQQIARTALRENLGNAGRADGSGGSRLVEALLNEGRGPIIPPNELRLSIDPELERVVARVVNTETQEVVREVPPEELLETARALRNIVGQIYSGRA
jgi:flagellar protein FlaG